MSKMLKILLTLAALVIIFAGIYAARQIVVPLMLSAFIAIITIPALNWLSARGVPHLLALPLIGVILIGGLLLLAALVSNSSQEFAQNIPSYRAQLEQQINQASQWLTDHGLPISLGEYYQYLDPSVSIQLVSNMLSGLSNLLTNSLLVVIIVLFILLEAATLPAKLSGGGNNNTLSHLKQIYYDIQQYFAIKALSSGVTGLSAGICLSLIGLDFSLLLGVVAALLNFIPNIGSIIAAVPAILIAWIQLGPYGMLVTVLIYIGINLVVGYGLEPMLYGKRLGLSPLVVILALVFWGWLLGTVGMLLSVPILIAIKIALQSHDDTKYIAQLFDSEAAPSAPQPNEQDKA